MAAGYHAGRAFRAERGRHQGTSTVTIARNVAANAATRIHRFRFSDNDTSGAGTNHADEYMIKKDVANKSNTVREFVAIGRRIVVEWTAAFGPPKWECSVVSLDDSGFWEDGKDQIGRDYSWWGFLAWAPSAARTLSVAAEQIEESIIPEVSRHLRAVRNPYLPQGVARDLARGFVAEAFATAPIVAQTRALDCWAAGLILGTRNDDSGRWPVGRFSTSAADATSPTFQTRWNAIGARSTEVRGLVSALDNALGRGVPPWAEKLVK